MTSTIRDYRPRATYLLQRAKSAAPSFRSKPITPTLQISIEQQKPTVVVYVDENYPSYGSQEIKNSYQQNGESTEQQDYDHYGSNHDFGGASQRPFHNNPPLHQTQRDIVGNNLRFYSSSQMKGYNNIDNENVVPLNLYRDALKRNLTTSTRIASGLSKMHFGRSGGHWPHIKQTNTYSGSNLLFVDGTVRADDSFKYPTPRFAYPQINRPQHSFASASTQSLSYPTTKALENMTWSATDELNRRPSLSQYSNRYERRAKEGFAYWPVDLTYQKPRCGPGTTGTYKTWLGLSDSVLKL